MADEPNLAGYRWYNDLEHVVEVQVYEETAGTRSILPAHDEDENQPEHGTADRIVCVLRVRTSTGKIENIEITGDIGFRNSSGAGWPDEDIAVVVANDTTITSDELTTMMVEAFFDPSYDGNTEHIPGPNRHTPSPRGHGHECKPLKQNGLQNSG